MNKLMNFQINAAINNKSVNETTFRLDVDILHITGS